MNLFKIKREKSELNSFTEHLKEAGIHVELFKKRKIQKCFDKKLPEVLTNLTDFLYNIGFNAFSITFEEKKEMSWYSIDSGRVVIDLALLDPRSSAHKEIVQKTAKKAREIEPILAELKLGQ